MRDANAHIRVMVSASSAVHRARWESAIANNPATRLVGGIYGLDALARHFRQLQPDVLLAELERPDSRLSQLSPLVDEEGAPVNVVALIDEPPLPWTTRALRGTVRAILNRDAAEGEVVRSIQAAYAGMITLELDLAEDLLRNVRLATPVQSELIAEPLTAREAEVLQMLAEGLGNRAIATRLAISEHTVKFHISSVLAKLGAASRTEAVTQGIRNGLILI